MDFLDREIEEEAQGGFVFTEITQRLLDEAKKHVPQLPAGLTVTQQRLVDALDAGGILVLWECLVLIVREHMVTEAEMARSDSGTGRARFDQTRTQDDCVPGRGSDSDSATEDDHVTLSRLDDLVLVPDSQPPIQTSPGPSYQPQKRSPRGDRSEGFTKYGHTCWNRFLTDVEKGTDTRLLYYLSALPSELLRSLIIGDLPSRMQDQDFSSRMKHFTTPTPSQGTYTMFIARLVCHSRMAISARRRHHCVAWVLTPGQTLDVIALVRLYADLDDPESEEMAKKIDAQFYQDVHKIDYATQRYYGGGGSRDQFHKHLLWAQSWVIALLANDNEKGEEPGYGRVFISLYLTLRFTSQRCRALKPASRHLLWHKSVTWSYSCDP